MKFVDIGSNIKGRIGESVVKGEGLVSNPTEKPIRKFIKKHIKSKYPVEYDSYDGFLYQVIL